MKQKQSARRAFLCILSMLCILLVSCTNAQRPEASEYKVKISDASMVGEALMDQTLQACMPGDKYAYQDETVSVERSETIDGIVRTATYDKTELYSGWDRTVDRYVNPENEVQLYFYHDTGAFLGYMGQSIIDQLWEGLTVLTDEERHVRAREIAETHVSVEGFTETRSQSEYETDHGVFIMYAYSYFREVEGFRSTEAVSVLLDQFGNIMGYFVYNVGAFENFEMPEVNLTDCDEAAFDYLDSIFIDIADSFTNIDYERTDDYILGCTHDGNITLSCPIMVDCTRGGNDYAYPLYVTVEIPA